MRLFVDFNDLGHHPRHLEHALSLEGGILLTSSAAYARLNRRDIFTTRLQIIVFAVKPQDFRAQVLLLLNYIDNNQTVTSCIHLAIDDIFRELLKSVLIKKPRICVEGVWMSCNTYYTKNISTIAAIKFYSLLLSWLIYIWLADGEQHGRAVFYFLNEDLADWIRNSIPGGKRFSQWVPDPADRFDGDIPDDQNYPSNSVVISFLGVHNKRKGTQWAIEALKKWKGPEIKVVVAGKCTDVESIKRAIGALPSTVLVELHNRVLSPIEWHSTLIASTIVCVPYRNFGGSSGVVANAILHKRKVLVSNFGLLGKRIGELTDTMIFEQDSSDDFISKLRQLIYYKLDPNIMTAYKKYMSIAKYCDTIR